nr:isochorismatase family protein [Flexivirga meconopsidis]
MLPVALDWIVSPARTLVLVHDMQRYFVEPFPEQMRADLVGNVAAVTQALRERGAIVAFSAQPGDMTSTERGLLNDFWGPGMKASPDQRQIMPELAPHPSDWHFTKWRYSAFHRSDLLQCMRESGRDQLVLCGVYAHVGILATALDAFTNDVQTFIVADAVADFSEQEHRWALDYAGRRCAQIIMSTEVVA